MPALTGTPVIRNAWRRRGEAGRIRYIANGGTTDRHLWVDAGDPLYDVLDELLRDAGYPAASYPGRLPEMPPAEPSDAEPKHGFSDSHAAYVVRGVAWRARHPRRPLPGTETPGAHSEQPGAMPHGA
jgi:hypothetical protein